MSRTQREDSNQVSEKLKLLALDDDPHLRGAISTLLSSEYEVLLAASPREAMEILHRMSTDGMLPAVMLLDIVMPEITGIELLRIVQQRYPDLPVVMLTSNVDARSIVDSMKAGASDYVVKGTEDFASELAMRVAQTISRHDLLRRNKKLEAKLESISRDVDMVGNTHGVLQVRSKILSVKGRSTTVLVTGESGTGKELVARLLNQQEGDSARPLVEVNCSTIPESLAESELFGHERGSFTHAVEKQPGKFMEAQDGDIFLDEIGELSLPIQAKLLRVLQEKKITPVGSTKSISVNVRVIAATNRNLKEEVQAGRFREDLYYRLAIFPIELPPLRDRKEDIPVLAEHFVREFGGPHATISHEALKTLKGHVWSGNIRELRNCIERAWILTAAEGRSAIFQDKLLFEDSLRSRANEDGPLIPSEILIWKEEDIKPEHLENYMSWAERTYFKTALNVMSNKTKLAEKLGLGKTFFFSKMRRLGLSD